MVKLRRVSIVEKYILESKDLTLESQKDLDDLREYLGNNLFDDYMQIRDKLPNLNNQFKTVDKLRKENPSKNSFITVLLNTYNRIISLLPENEKTHYNQCEDSVNELSEDEDLLDSLINDYNKVREIVFEDQKKYRDFQLLKKVPKRDVIKFVSNFQSKTSKKKEDAEKYSKKIFNNLDWLVLKITGYPAAKKYGENTTWCITGRYGGHEEEGEYWFNKYIDDENLDGGYYFFISKDDDYDKYCLLLKENGDVHSIWDAEDNKCYPEELLEIADELPFGEAMRNYIGSDVESIFEKSDSFYEFMNRVGYDIDYSELIDGDPLWFLLLDTWTDDFLDDMEECDYDVSFDVNQKNSVGSSIIEYSRFKSDKFLELLLKNNYKNLDELNDYFQEMCDHPYDIPYLPDSLKVLKEYKDAVAAISEETLDTLYASMDEKDIPLLMEVFPKHTFELNNDLLYKKFLKEEDMDLLYKMTTPLSLEVSSLVISNIYLMEHSDEYISLFKKGILNKDSQYQGSGLPHPISVLTFLVSFLCTSASEREKSELEKILSFIKRTYPDAVKKTSSELEKLRSFNSMMPDIINAFNDFVDNK